MNISISNLFNRNVRTFWKFCCLNICSDLSFHKNLKDILRICFITWFDGFYRTVKWKTSLGNANVLEQLFFLLKINYVFPIVTALFKFLYFIVYIKMLHFINMITKYYFKITCNIWWINKKGFSEVYFTFLSFSDPIRRKEHLLLFK